MTSPIKREVTIGNCRLLLGDCLEILPLLGKVDAVVTDPPYAIPTIVATGRETTRSVGDLSIVEAAFRVFFDQCGNILTPAGRTFVFCDGTSYPVVFRASFGRFSSALLVWDKGQIGMGREFRKSHELILHAWQRETPIFGDGVGRADILKYSPVSSEARTHPAEKPVGLLQDLIRTCGDHIIDPFMGSASTGVACIRSERKFTGIEIEERFFDIACRRIQDAVDRPDLFITPRAPEPVQQPLFGGEAA